MALEIMENNSLICMNGNIITLREWIIKWDNNGNKSMLRSDLCHPCIMILEIIYLWVEAGSLVLVCRYVEMLSLSQISSQS